MAAKPKPPARASRAVAKAETLEDRVAYNLKLSGPGKMPIDMLFKTEVEVATARAYLKRRRITHIGAKLDDRQGD